MDKEIEEIIQGYTGKLRTRIIKIAQNIKRLEELIEAVSPGIADEPLYISSIAGERKPHEVRKENPALKEYKSLITTHEHMIKELKEILELHDEPQPEQLDEWDMAFENMREMRREVNAKAFTA